MLSQGSCFAVLHLKLCCYATAFDWKLIWLQDILSNNVYYKFEWKGCCISVVKVIGTHWCLRSTRPHAPA